MDNKQIASGIIKYHNALTDVPLSEMSATDANIFMVTCFHYQKVLRERFKSIEELDNCIQEDIPHVEYNISEFIKACNYKRGGPSKFVKAVKSVREKLGSVSIDIVSDDEDVRFPFFYEFRTDKRENIFRVQIHKNAAYLLLFFQNGCYTLHEIGEFVRVSSVYAKRCYMQLKKWRTQGEWNVDIDTFRHTLGVPHSYKAGDIDRYVLNVIKEQLSPYFKNIHIEKVHKKERGEPIGRIIITFDKEPAKQHKETGFNCPICGKPLVEKNINGKTCWCHEDGWKPHSECKVIFNSVAEIRGYSENPERREKQENTPEVITNRIGEIF